MRVGNRASSRVTAPTPDQAHQHDVVITAAQIRLLALHAFVDEAKSAIEPQRPLVERDDAQIKLVKIEAFECIIGNQRERLAGEALAMSAALADQNA